MKKIIVVLFLSALTFVASSFASVNSVAVVQNVDGAITTCPACGCEVTYYDFSTKIFSCPSCHCQWKKVSGTVVMIIMPPDDVTP